MARSRGLGDVYKRQVLWRNTLAPTCKQLALPTSKFATPMAAKGHQLMDLLMSFSSVALCLKCLKFC
jgi:hypothetical protein